MIDVWATPVGGLMFACGGLQLPHHGQTGTRASGRDSRGPRRVDLPVRVFVLFDPVRSESGVQGDSYFMSAYLQSQMNPTGLGSHGGNRAAAARSGSL